MVRGIRIEKELKKLMPCFLFSDRGYLGENGIKNLQEGIGFPPGPSDPDAIHIFLKQKLNCIVRSDTSAIKDFDLPGCWFPESICDFVSDDLMCLLGLSRRCRFLCTDSPIGLIKDLASGYFVRMEIFEDDFHLLLDGVGGLA
jgi:hypothetical protein